MHEDERYQAGLRERRRVLGDAHVDRALAARTEFTGEFQDMITRHASRISLASAGRRSIRYGIARSEASCSIG